MAIVANGLVCVLGDEGWMIAGDEHRKARELWDRKPALRVVYGHLYRMIVETLTAGTILEIGAGGGRRRSSAPIF